MNVARELFCVVIDQQVSDEHTDVVAFACQIYSK